MKQMIAEYADKGGFGADTYWGGKGLTQMAHYMTFAHEMGETELCEKCKSRLKAVLENWLTYVPGEQNFFFARYNRWGALVGYNTSYDSETFNDHHFHYGYFTYAASLLAMLLPPPLVTVMFPPVISRSVSALIPSPPAVVRFIVPPEM
jgi:endoglucanase Acf2